MKAIVLTEYGGIDKLEPRDLPEPATGPGEIKVRVAGASINPVDYKLRSGALEAMMPLELPAVLGRDASGTVVETGLGVTRFEVGDRVLGLVMGAYAERVVAKEEAWATVPAALDLADAGALPLVVLTGAQLIEEALNPRAGDVVLVTGAAGAVGRAAVYAAKARGAKVWAGVRRDRLAEASGLGADGVVALDDPSAVDRLPTLDGIADTVGGETLDGLLGKVKKGGTVASVVGEPAGTAARGLVGRAMWAHPDAARLEALTQAVADGKLVIPIERRLPLADAGEAQRLAEHHAGGKILLLGEPHPSS